MPKKDFTKKNASTLDAIRTKATNDTQSVKSTKDTSDIKEEYRFPARFNKTQWQYLSELKWQSRRSITAIIQDLVEADMKKHPEILKSIDELND